MLPNFVDTPEGLKSEICHLNGNIINMPICEYIKNLSNKFNCLFVPESIKTPGTSSFRCQHGSRDRGKRTSSKKVINCISQFRLLVLNDKKVYYLDGIWSHNHVINEYMNNIHHSNLSEETIGLIKTGLMLGTSTGALRRSLKLMISPDQLYYYRRLLNDSINDQYLEIQSCEKIGMAYLFILISLMTKMEGNI